MSESSIMPTPRKTGRMRLLPIASDGLQFILIPLLPALACFVLQWWIPGGILLAVASYVAYFFRDPERKPPGIEGAILSSADGKVTAIDEVDHPEFEGGRARRISIFLSIFNVHINRSPIAGAVGEVKYSPGRFISATSDKSAAENEHNIVQFASDRCQIFVKQIAGMIARRIVCRAKPGEHYGQGERYGLIRFGSRVDTFLPLSAEVKVKKRMIVKGGVSILAILDNPLKTDATAPDAGSNS